MTNKFETIIRWLDNHFYDDKNKNNCQFILAKLIINNFYHSSFRRKQSAFVDKVNKCSTDRSYFIVY